MSSNSNVKMRNSADTSTLKLRLLALAFSALVFNDTAVFGFVTTSSAKQRQSLRLFSSTAAWNKKILEQGNGQELQLGDIASIRYTCYLPDNPNAIPVAKSTSSKFAVGDRSMIPGWEQALRTMKVGERALVRVENAYGPKGVPPIIPPNSNLVIDLQVLSAQPATANIDFDQIAAMVDTTPRTPADIAAAYQARQVGKAPAKEGFEGFVDRVKNFYFFGLFQGETGEQAPWILRPSITFPIAFLIIGAAFYVSYIGGAISERGAQKTDELDEIVLTSSISTMYNAITGQAVTSEQIRDLSSATVLLSALFSQFVTM